MKTIMELLRQNPQVSDYKINIHQKESCELFFVKGKLETVRRTKTCDKEVTVYVEHDGFKGDSKFFVYPSTTTEQIRTLIGECVAKALLINNQTYTLPGAESGHFEVRSNFAGASPIDLATRISDTVFAANRIPCASLNSVEIFVNKHTETIVNSRGLDKSQVRYDAMVEAIPTYNGETQSVELYEQYNFNNLDTEELTREIAGKMAEVEARYEAVKPDFALDCNVILGKLELSELFSNIARNLNYTSVYTHTNLFKKGDMVQKAPEEDRIGMVMAGEVTGSVKSSRFDSDGLSLDSIRILDAGKVVNYYGSNRFGQYLGEQPTGTLPCLCVDAGTADADAFRQGASLEVVSMSGLQVDFYNDYIGGEVRLAYYHDGSKTIPVTGISISGKLSEVLNHIRLSAETAVHNGYSGPRKALLSHMKIF